MSKHTLESSRELISSKVRQLRKEQRWPQSDLAILLGISQNWLSVVERGEGSFTAEQLLLLLKTFNVPISYFSTSKREGKSEIQNALARLGARHLLEDTKVLPSEKYENAVDVIKEALIAAETPRQITAIAPALVQNIAHIDRGKLYYWFIENGFGVRLGWILENTLESVRLELKRPLSNNWKSTYKRAEFILDIFLDHTRAQLRNAPLGKKGDILDGDIRSQKTVEEIQKSRSSISKWWGVITRIQVEDFVQALRAARGEH